MNVEITIKDYAEFFEYLQEMQTIVNYLEFKTNKTVMERKVVDLFNDLASKIEDIGDPKEVGLRLVKE